MTSPLIRMEPVWVNGKLVTPKDWISPETRERMAKAQADCEADQKAMRESGTDYPCKLHRGKAARRNPVTPDQWPKDMR